MINDSLGGTHHRGTFSNVNNFLSSVLDCLDKILVQEVLIRDVISDGFIFNLHKMAVRVLRIGVIAPDNHVFDLLNGNIGLHSQLLQRPVMVKPGQAGKIGFRN